MKAFFGFMTLLLVGCGQDYAGEDQDIEAGRAYTSDQSFRRSVLENAIENPHNTYSAERLAKYATNPGWDDLPEYSPTVIPFGVPDAETIQFDTVEWTHEGLMEAGRLAFENYPMRTDWRFDVLLDSPERHGEAGLGQNADGHIGGLVKDTAKPGLAWTCATCHSSVVDGDYFSGRSNENLDVSALYSMVGKPNTVVATWGPGRIDPTNDHTNNPSNVPDLRAVRFQSHLHLSATLKNSLIALAIRVETLLIISSGETTRPPRDLAFAIAYYLWNIESPTPLESGKGRDVFRKNCSSCHHLDGTTATPIPIDVIGTDPILGRSPSRGTGYYRIPSLAHVGTRGRLLHDGVETSLDEFLDPTRYRRQAGHAHGTTLPLAERQALIGFLKSW